MSLHDVMPEDDTVCLYSGWGAWWCRVRTPVGQTYIIFHKNVYIISWVHSASYLMGIVGPGSYPPTNTTQVKNEYSGISASSVCLHGVDVDSFTFLTEASSILILDITTKPRTQPTLYALWHNTKDAQRFLCNFQHAKERELGFCNAGRKITRGGTNRVS